MPAPSALPFSFALNTSTIKGQKLPLATIVDLTAGAGYDGIEPWIGEIDQYVAAGGSLAELGERMADHGLVMAGAIGFFEWCVDDDARRAAGMVEAERNMELVRQLGGTALAAPPWGAHATAGVSLDRIAERYRALLELGERMGVTPLLELWGPSRTLSRLSEVLYVAAAANHPGAALLLDVYHLYKGGTEAAALALVSGQSLGLLHLNDYPAAPPRATIGDGDRVYPGDGIAPLDTIFRTLHANGYRGMLSLELFHPGYWQQDAASVARTGLLKAKAAVRHAFAES